MNDITDVETEPQAEDCDGGGNGAIISHAHAKEQHTIVHEILNEAFRKLNPTPDQRESFKRFGCNIEQLPVDAFGQHVLVVGSACNGSGMDMVVLNV